MDELQQNKIYSYKQLASYLPEADLALLIQ